MEIFKYIVYGIFEIDTGLLTKVGRYPSTSQTKSQARIEKNLKPGSMFKQMGEFDKYDDCIKLVIHMRRNIIKLGEDGEVDIPIKREGKITNAKGINGSRIRRGRPLFTDRHKPGDVNGELMYIKDWTGSHQIIKV